jgi:acyl transferase domain-containing protein/NAD(P)-dependent dehydrogenase (short-subunit alcohol dehydrogenase family)
LAIVGIGCLFPKAAGPGFYWANVKQGIDCITDVPPTHWDPADYYDPDPKKPDMTYARRGGFLDAVEFNPLEFGIAPRDIEATDTTQLLGLVAAKQALADAGVILAPQQPQPVPDSGRGDTSGHQLGSPKTVDRSRVSVILGVTGTLELVIPLGARLGHPRWKRAMKAAGIPDDLVEDAAARIAESYVPWQENSFPGLLGNVVAGRIANRLDLGGTNCVVDAACASSLSAVHLAALELQANRADVVVTGGCDTFNDIFMYMCFSKTPALSPTGNAKPFDANGDGTILGEGLGVVVLKRLADAQRAGDTIYAVLRGIGSSSDGKGNAIYAPSAEGQRRCLWNAYRLAGVTPDTIELVEAHGTGTKVGDATEATALTEVFRPSRRQPGPWCAIGSVKSQIGHTKAAAGAASLIKAVLALHYKVLPPTIKVTKPVEPLTDPDTPFYVNTMMRPWLPREEHPRRAALSAFGFGGSNFHAVLEEARPDKLEVDWDGSTEILALSAATREELATQLHQVPSEWNAFARLAEQTRRTFDAAAPCRLCLAAHRTLTDLSQLLQSARRGLAENQASSWSLPEGAFFGSGPAGQLAILFPGQGSQAVGMLRELTCQFPEMLETLAQANAAIATHPRLSDWIYPPTRFDAELQKQDEAILRRTENAQPALGAINWGAWRLLHERFQLQADAFAGHSYGELVALAAAGCFPQHDLFKLSRLRGELMSAQRPGESGGMLAVLAPLNRIEQILAELKSELVVANKNAPNQTVLSGPIPELERAAQAFQLAGITATRLPVSAAFHSPLVADAAVPFEAALQQVPVVAPAKPVFSNTTAREYPNQPQAIRTLLANQLARPVAFTDQILEMARQGMRVFLEVGPGAVLTRLVQAILSESSHSNCHAVALNPSGLKRRAVVDLAVALAQLAALGHQIELAAWERNSRCRPAPPADSRPGLSIPITGANYVTPRPSRPAAPVARVERSTSVHPTMSDSMPESDANTLAQALLLTQQNLAAIQRMQEQTAALHKHFLDHQDAAQRALQTVIEQQQLLLTRGTAGAGMVLPVQLPFQPSQPAPTTPTPTPTPAVVPVAPPSPPTPVAAALPTTSLLQATPPAAPAVPQTTAPVVPTSDRVTTTLLAVVSEKTGYPVESLDLSLSLDADLGVDSIKRVEILSALQERLPGAPVVKPEHLGTLQTLRDVAQFLGGGSATSCSPVPNGNGVAALDSRSVSSNLSGSAPDVASTLLAVVSEKTGYPVESLDLSLSLDADLGVDSIKRVEILSALQERLPGAPVVKPEHLGTLQTLRDVAQFLSGSVTGTGLTTAPTQTQAPSAASVQKNADFAIPAPPKTETLSPLKLSDVPILPDQLSGEARRLGSVQLPAARLVNTEALRVSSDQVGVDRIDRSIVQTVDLDLTQPRPQIPLSRGSMICVVGNPEPLTQHVIATLAEKGFIPQAIAWDQPHESITTSALAGLVLIAPQRPPADLNQRAFEWIKQAGPKLREAGRTRAAVLASVARLDGAFGHADLAPDADPIAGGLAGLVKTARLEWPEVACKAIDLNPAFDGSEAARAVVDELLLSGPIEVGISATYRCTLELARSVRRPATQLLDLGPKDVFLITGGARGVTAEIAVALAETYSPTLILVGRTPTLEHEPAWLAGLVDEAELKKAISSHLGSSAGPRQVGEYYQQVLAQREIRVTLQRIAETQAKVHYISADITDAKKVSELLTHVEAQYGPITAVVHGAGVLADRRIDDLTRAQFDTVYSTKVAGLRHILDHLGQQPLKALVLFSSTTARLGRVGQVAYACANEVLNKTAQVQSRRRPNCRVVAINWGPWEGGMVTPSLRRLFESEGVGLIPLLEGAVFLLQELNTVGKAVEVIALGKLRGNSGLIPPAIRTPPPADKALPGVSPFGANSPAQADFTQAFERVVDPVTHPVLAAHVIDGRAVVPMALHLEWLAHAALHGNPGLVFHGFNDLRITHGVQIDPLSSVQIRAVAGKAVKQERLFVVPVELRSRRKDGREVIHSRAEIVLTASLPPVPPADQSPHVSPAPYSVQQAYRELLFHGPELQGIERIKGISERAVIATAYPAPLPAEWFQFPLRSNWVADPLVLDCSFQMMILWTLAQHGSGSLPCFAGRYRQYRKNFPSDPTTVVIRIRKDDGKFARADIDYLDAEGRIIAQMQDYECVIEKSLAQAFRRNQLVSP